MTINSITGNTLLTSGSFPPVRAASTGSPLNPATGGLLVVDGVQLVAGDRVLCKDEANPVNNGIYAASTGPWTRTSDAAGNQQFFSGMAVTVALGVLNAGLTYICTTTDDPVVVGASLITFAAQSAVATATQSATSATSLALGVGSKTFTIAAGKAFQVGQWVLVNETSNNANQLFGQVTAYAGTSLTVNVTATGGSGTHADWTIVLANSAAAAGLQPPVGSGNVTGPGSSAAGHVATFADATGKVLADGGAPVGGANSITPSMFANAAVGFALGMLNGTLVATVAGSALTIAVKTLAGVDPTPGDPVFFLIRDTVVGYVVIEQTAALNITVPSGATLGTVNGQANRIWVGVFNNGGAVLGVYNSLNASAPSILCWDETSPANGTGITSSAISPQIWFTASTLAAKNFRIVGYVESTQPTAGTWSNSAIAKLFGPGVKKPGDEIQEVSNFVSGAASINSPTYVPLNGETLTINVQSAASLIRVKSAGTIIPPGAGGGTTGTASVRLSRGTVAATNLFGAELSSVVFYSASGTVTIQSAATLFGYDIPNVTGNVTYATQGKSNGTMTFGGNTQLAAWEIQI